MSEFSEELQPPTPSRKEVQTPPPPRAPLKQEQDQQAKQKEELEQLRISSEYDEDRELRAKNMPTIYSFANKKEQFHYMYGDEADEEQITKQFGPIRYREGLKPVLVTPNFNISDIHIRDAKGLHIVGTFAV